MNILYIILLAVNLFSPYVSSWMGNILPFPPGAFLRDAINASFIILVLMRFFLDKRKIHNVLMFNILAWLSLTLWVMTLIVFSADKMQAIMGARSYILFPGVYFALVMMKIQYPQSIDIKKIIRYTINLMIIAALIAIIDVLMKGGFIKLLGYNEHYAGDDLNLINSYDDVVRATGGFSDALNFGYMLTLGILLSMECFARGYKRCLMLGVSLILFIAICMTLTRGAILIAIIIYSFYIFSNRNLLIGGIISVLIILPVLMMSTNILDKYTDILVGRFTDSSQTSKGSTQGRIDMAINSIAYLSDHPLGVGLGTQGSGNMLSVKDNRLNTDNYFFWMALETGIAGLFINLWFLSNQFYATWSLTRGQFKQQGGKTFRPILLLGIAYFISSALSSAPSSSTFSIFFWTTLAIIPFIHVISMRKA